MGGRRLLHIGYASTHLQRTLGGADLHVLSDVIGRLGRRAGRVLQTGRPDPALGHSRIAVWANQRIQDVLRLLRMPDATSTTTTATAVALAATTNSAASLATATALAAAAAAPVSVTSAALAAWLRDRCHQHNGNQDQPRRMQWLQRP